LFSFAQNRFRLADPAAMPLAMLNWVRVVLPLYGVILSRPNRQAAKSVRAKH
jgi:hypothetical protein